MVAMNSKSRQVVIRLPQSVWQEYDRLVKNSPKNPHETAGRMMKWVLCWYPYRHSTRKYRAKQ